MTAPHMELDVLGLLGACSYALDCVEAELVHVTTFHAKRVAYMSVCTAEQFGVSGEALQDLAVCALLHDNALTQYLHEEFRGDSSAAECLPELPHLGAHCVMGEENISALPFHTNVENIILYHHENADGSGSFGKTWQEIPLGARIIHLCDLLDAFCRADVFTPDVWERANAFLTRVRGRIVDEECADAFLRAFSEQHFCSLGGRGLEERLWSKVPRTKQQLDFAQVKALAKFFAKIVDYKSPFTSTHSLGVADDAECLARFMGFDEDTAQKMYLAGALHDIGKVAIDNKILEKPGRLTDSEYAEMKHHAAYTYYVLSEVQDFAELRDWAAFHHEHLDGTGYPFGKNESELNTQERIMACVDIYQALTENRPYKAGMSHEKACSILLDMAEKGWLDRAIVEQVNACFA